MCSGCCISGAATVANLNQIPSPWGKEAEDGRLEQIGAVGIEQGLLLGHLAFSLGKFIGVNLNDKFLFLFYV